MSPFAGVGHHTQDEQEWNNAMVATRIEVEHGFGEVTRQWPMLNAWWKLKINASPVGRYIGLQYYLPTHSTALGPIRLLNILTLYLLNYMSTFMINYLYIILYILLSCSGDTLKF
jgi:hypothetical protein